MNPKPDKVIISNQQSAFPENKSICDANCFFNWLVLVKDVKFITSLPTQEASAIASRMKSL